VWIRFLREEIRERGRAKISRFILFDGVTIALSDVQENSATLVYAAGMGMAIGRQGSIFPLSGTGEERGIKTRTALLLREIIPRRFWAVQNIPSLLQKRVSIDTLGSPVG
jgi:hypothetical protein